MKRVTNFLAESTVLLASLVFVILAIQSNVFATTQWSRKYKTSCTTCHTVFPRLNYYGERFLRNGYQDPDSDDPDGGTLGKTKINDYLSIDELGNFIGLRLNFTPIQMKTNSLVIDGKKETQFTIGNTNWYQVFFAGSLAKNISLFIEAENDGKSMHFSWAHLGFHNLGGTTLANVFVGNVATLDFGSYPNRLPQIAALKGDIFQIASSGGAKAVADDGNGVADDVTGSTASRPGIMWFGYKGPVVAWAGISSGSTAKDNNGLYHYWGALRLEIPESMESTFEGSNVTAWFYKGEDATATATQQITNPFTRISLQGNLRFGHLDVQAAYLTVTEDNYYLRPDSTKKDEKYSGISVLAGQSFGQWHPYIQFDTVTYDDKILAEGKTDATTSKETPGKDRMFVTPAIGYSLKENIRVIGVYRLDLTKEQNGYKKSNEAQINIRMMF